MPRAGRRCPDIECDARVPCPDHGQPWASSQRRSTLPADWPAIRRAVLDRDAGRCQLAYPDSWPTRAGTATCQVIATEVDHIHDADCHELGNLRAVCSACHRRRTQRQAAAARRRQV